MINKEILKKEIKSLKKLLSYCSSCEQFKNSLEIIYTRISNTDNKEYSKKYDLMEICNNKTIKELGKKFADKNSSIVEFVKYDKENCGFVLIYNEFDTNNYPSEWEFYVLKSEQNL